MYLVDAPGKCPRMVVVFPDEPEARCYGVHPEDAEGEIQILRVKRGDLVGTLTLRPVPASTRARGGSGYARVM